MSNKSAGTAFEKEFAEILSGIGFWVHRLQDNKNGQPFDLIAVMNGKALAFDCKDCQYDDFSLYRIEENQMNAMTHWRKCGNTEGLFVIRLPNQEIRILNFSTVELLIESGEKRLRGNVLREHTIALEEWIHENHDQQ